MTPLVANGNDDDAFLEVPVTQRPTSEGKSPKHGKRASCKKWSCTPLSLLEPPFSFLHFFAACDISRMGRLWSKTGHDAIQSRCHSQIYHPLSVKIIWKNLIYCSSSKMSNLFQFTCFFCTSEVLAWYVGVQFVQRTKVTLRKISTRGKNIPKISLFNLERWKGWKDL